jgi:hypothetical protein
MSGIVDLDPERRLVGVTPRGPLSLPSGGAHWYEPRSVGYPEPTTFLSTLESPVAHTIDPEFLPELREFVGRAIG